MQDRDLNGTHGRSKHRPLPIQEWQSPGPYIVGQFGNCPERGFENVGRLVSRSLSTVSEAPVQSTSADTFPLVDVSDTALRLPARLVQLPECLSFEQPPKTFRTPMFRLHHHGMVSFSQRVHHFRSDIRQFTSLPWFHLLSHRLKVSLIRSTPTVWNGVLRYGRRY